MALPGALRWLRRGCPFSPVARPPWRGDVSKEEALAILERLKRRHGPTLADVIAKREALRREFDGLKGLDDRIAACGLGVLQDEHIGLYDIAVAPELRRRGYATRGSSGRANSRNRVTSEFVRSTSEEMKPVSSRAVSFG